MSVKPVLFIVAVLALVVFIETRTDKRQRLIEYFGSTGDADETRYIRDVVYRFNHDEVNTFYDFVFNYIEKNKRPAPGSAMAAEVEAVYQKYNLRP